MPRLLKPKRCQVIIYKGPCPYFHCWDQWDWLSICLSDWRAGGNSVVSAVCGVPPHLAPTPSFPLTPGCVSWLASSRLSDISHFKRRTIREILLLQRESYLKCMIRKHHLEIKIIKNTQWFLFRLLGVLVPKLCLQPRQYLGSHGLVYAVELTSSLQISPLGYLF